MPQKLAGWRMEPPVSVPMEAKHWPAATLAAEPPLEPPGTRVASQGFLVTLKAEFSVDEPMANSSMLALARMMAPASLSRVTQWAS